MHNRLFATAVIALACVAAPPAHAGAGTLTGSITPLGDANVTYSIASPPMPTYVGYTVALANTGRNTINHISFTVTATATDPAETVQLFSEADYLPPECSKTAPNVFTCEVGQLKSGEAFPSFQVFYTAPVKAVNGKFDADNTDFINAEMRVIYAEGLNGPKSKPQNSIRDFDAPPVRLGTANPDRIKSSVPKVGASLYTGTAGIPTSDNKSTMLASIPPLTTSFTTADLKITRVHDSDATLDGANCLTQGHFKECPVYTVTVPGTSATFTSFLKTTYRIDCSSLKMAPHKILNSTLIQYQKTESSPVSYVQACPALDTPTGTGVPCVNKKQCFKYGELAGDCEWELINTENGLTKFF